ncbi:alginate lyase family protein [Mucilaginibacter sp. PAMB04168]|uniref:alginate lyase family protein n=1 Tax=Mucilaginibacter sp. PAMB04168 TaxID=3138567 RepID=UPI0031F63354
MKIISKGIFLSVFLLKVISLQAQPFIHPGILQSQEDLVRLKKGVLNSSQPLYAGYLVFKAHAQSQPDYKVQGAMPTVGRNPTVGQAIYDADANAAYQNAIMWTVTGEQRYAEKSKEIINKWASTLQEITGRDAVLMAGLGPFKMVNAAEILRYTNAGWRSDDIKKAEVHFKTVIYPVIKDFAPFANGNWDSAALKTMMAIAIFCNDRMMFERAIVYYQYGWGDGSLPNYIINEQGQCQESGRDQGHTQLGIAHLADCSEMAWNQGLNLYSIYDNRLLKGFEYTAKYNLGMEVPYVPAMDRTGKYLHPRISEQDRGKLRAVYEEVYNHYVHRISAQAPYTQQAAEKVRPELQGLPGADHIGFGTFLYSRADNGANKNRSHNNILVAPAGLHAEYESKSIHLTWVPVIGATSYIVKRAQDGEGTFKIIAKGIKHAAFYDLSAAKGNQYRYTVCSVNGEVQSSNAYPLAISAGLPSGWKQTDLSAKRQSVVNYIDNTFIIQSSGMGMDVPYDKAMFVTKAVNGDATIGGKYIPQLSSQFTGFGLTFREASDVGSKSVEIVVSPRSTSQIEAPGWVVQLRARTASSDSSDIIYTSPVISEPAVTYNRLTGPVWLKLERENNLFTAAYSTDGKTWMTAGSAQLNCKKSGDFGMLVYSGIKDVPTTVRFGEVKITR